jgi:predicted O-methyltransferase YrrM
MTNCSRYGSGRHQAVYDTDLWCARGHFNKAQADKYAELCAELHPRFVLEVGFCTGRSAISILYHTEPSLKRMVSIDRSLASDGRRMAATIMSHYPTFEVIEAPSRETLMPTFFARVFPDGIDLATVDGDHSYDACTSDLEAIAQHLTPTGIMVVDDYRSGPPDGVTFDSVTRSVDDFLAVHAGTLCGETWHVRGKGFCLIRRRGIVGQAGSGKSDNLLEARWGQPCDG